MGNTILTAEEVAHFEHWGDGVDDLAASHEALREERDAAIQAREEQRRIGVRALQMANDSERKNNLLRAERDTATSRALRALRDALVENAAQAKQIQELTNALAWIGDKAVCDFDDPTVGDVRRALENVPQTYRDAYVAYMRRTNEVYAEMRALGPVEWECSGDGFEWSYCAMQRDHGVPCEAEHTRAIRVVKGGA